MKYILTQEELENLISMEQFLRLETTLEYLLDLYKKSVTLPCAHGGEEWYCDACPIAGINLPEGMRICCEDDNYSK